MFRLGRPDVLPVDDYGVRKGFALAFRKRELPAPKAREVRRALAAVPHGGELVPVACDRARKGSAPDSRPTPPAPASTGSRLSVRAETASEYSAPVALRQPERARLNFVEHIDQDANVGMPAARDARRGVAVFEMPVRHYHQHIIALWCELET